MDAFKETEIKENDVNSIPKEEVGEFQKKSPSQRLYDRMLVYYKSTRKNLDGFENWRISALDSYGQQFLDKIK